MVFTTWLVSILGCGNVGAGGAVIPPTTNSGSGSAGGNVPSSPTLQPPVAADSQVTLSWPGIFDAISYTLYYSTNAGVTPSTGTAQLGVTSPHTQTGLTNGTTYYFVLAAVNAVGESPISGEVSAMPVAATALPGVPTLNAPTAGDSQVTLTWALVPGATAYNLYYSNAPGATPSTGTAQLGVTSPHTQTGLTNGTTYYFVLTAVNAVGESAISVEVSATPVAATALPGVPTLNVPTAGDGQVRLTWASVPGATTYNLYYSNAPGVTASTGTAHLGVTSPHTHTGLTNGTTYYFVLTAVNAVGESPISNEVNVTALSTSLSPPPSTSLSGPVAGDAQVTLLWGTLGAWPGQPFPSYNLYFRNSPGVTTSNGTKIAGVSSVFHHTGLTNGVPYYYRVTAFNAAGESPISNEVGAIPQAAGMPGWVQTMPATHWGARSSTTSVVFNNKLWVLAGYNSGAPRQDVWTSTDGVNWVQATTAAPWNARHGHASVDFNGKMYIVGGYATRSQFGNGAQNDVWSSTDGANWIQETAAAPWRARGDHTSVVFNGKVWMIGGLEKVNNSTNQPANDVWSSADGVNWVRETAAASWSARSKHTTVVFNNRLWVIGGYSSISAQSDVWSSADGVNWTQETAAAPWGARYSHASAVFNGKIWVIGGAAGGAALNDVWSSVDGINWIQEGTTASWGARGGHASAVFNSRLWIMGGSVDGILTNEVWSSADGVTWRLEIAVPLWTTRASHTSADFNGKLWVLGGYGSSYRNDVWSSTDGANWTMELARAPWSVRFGHSSVVFNGKLWVLGGYGIGYRNDVWSSVDGVNWTQESAAAPWIARSKHTSAVFNGKIWVLGGYSTGSVYHNDVWSSPDGVNWTQETAAAPWSARAEHTSAVFGGKLWVIGGDGSGYKKDVWSSPDGVNWTQETAAAPWNGRYGHTSVEFYGKLWVIGGFDDSPAGWRKDIWSSVDGVNWTQEATAAPWGRRSGHNSVIFNNKLWVLGGAQSFDSLVLEEVWYYQ